MPKTIILHGTGRSGTSMLNNILVEISEVDVSQYQFQVLDNVLSHLQL